MSDLVLLDWASAPLQAREAWHHEAIKRMPQVHANRQKEWALARLCLGEALAQHGIRITPASCVFKGHHELTHLPAWRFSLSHTQDRAAAWLMPSAQVRGLGLDIERTERKVPAQIKARLAHPQDITLPALELWALKEAAYKALPAIAQEGIWLNRLIMGDGTFLLEGSPFRGSWGLQRREGLLVAQAWLPP